MANFREIGEKIWKFMIKSNEIDLPKQTMLDWKELANKAKKSLNSKNLAQASQDIQYALEIHPNHSKLLAIAINVYRSLNEYEKSLEYSELLIANHPDNWKGYFSSAQNLLDLTKVNSSRFYDITESESKIISALEKFPDQAELLVLAIDIHRTAGDHNKSLEFSDQLISRYPNKWLGYGYAAQDLATLKRHEEAREKLDAGLKTSPKSINLLLIGIDIYRSLDNLGKCLELANRLTTHHPERWVGYELEAQLLIKLNRPEDARHKIKNGLEKFPSQMNLLATANRAHQALGRFEKSLEYAEQLIIHHPGIWLGYGRAAQDLIMLKRFDEARIKIALGLEKFPDQPRLVQISKKLKA